jgi:hypothetical protein
MYAADLLDDLWRRRICRTLKFDLIIPKHELSLFSSVTNVFSPTLTIRIYEQSYLVSVMWLISSVWAFPAWAKLRATRSMAFWACIDRRSHQA